jgi:hypothetical protein
MALGGNQSRVERMRVFRTLPALVALSLASSSVLAAQPKPRPALKMLPTEREALGAMLRLVLTQLPDSAVSACVVLRGGAPSFWYDPDSSLLASLRSTRRPVLRASECPPTYDVMAVYRDSAGNDVTPRRPPGYVDPFQIQIQEQRLIGTDSAYAVVRASQGTFNYGYVCGARYRGTRWQASCRYGGRSISSLPPNVSLQLTSARSAEASRLAAYRDAITSAQVSRILSRPLAAELRR